MAQRQKENGQSQQERIHSVHQAADFEVQPSCVARTCLVLCLLELDVLGNSMPLITRAFQPKGLSRLHGRAQAIQRWRTTGLQVEDASKCCASRRCFRPSSCVASHCRTHVASPQHVNSEQAISCSPTPCHKAKVIPDSVGAAMIDCQMVPLAARCRT